MISRFGGVGRWEWLWIDGVMRVRVKTDGDDGNIVRAWWSWIPVVDVERRCEEHSKEKIGFGEYMVVMVLVT
jgi:hypothetical protein